jgi:FKBP-type peptidyl-prolyl cis-trans isomerase FkpA
MWKKKQSVLTGLIIVLAVYFLTGCVKDNSEELKAEEQRLLDQYLKDHNITQEPTSSGIYHIPLVEGAGDTPSDSSWVEFEFVGELVDGTVFNTNIEIVAQEHGMYLESFIYGPSRFQMAHIGIRGLKEGLQYMKAGGSSQFIIPSDQAFGGGYSEVVPPYSTLIYTIDLTAVFDDPNLYEEEQIQQFLDQIAHVTEPTESGLYYMEELKGTGDTIQPGDLVQIWYKGYFLDGRVFDSNREGVVMERTLPDDNLIQGINEGLMLMREGSKGILIIPHDLAYGSQGVTDPYGNYIIPPYKTVVFEIEVVDII